MYILKTFQTKIVGQKGDNGYPGRDGKDGVDGERGAPGGRGQPGEQGDDGQPGPRGGIGLQVIYWVGCLTLLSNIPWYHRSNSDF